MKGLLNEVSRLQKLAGILNENHTYSKYSEDFEVDLEEAKKKKKKKKGPGLWTNVLNQRKRGEKPAHPNSKEFKDAVKAGKEINKNK